MKKLNLSINKLWVLSIGINAHLGQGRAFLLGVEKAPVNYFIVGTDNSILKWWPISATPFDSWTVYLGVGWEVH